MTKCKHTKCPTGYIAWHEWAEKKSKTHKQIKCPHCDRYAIWVKCEICKDIGYYYDHIKLKNVKCNHDR